MQVFNYAAYAKTFELGVSKPNMTKIARVLFEPVFQLEDLVNRAGNPYTMNSKLAKAWYQQSEDIPGNIKTAAGRPELVNSIGDYFSEKIIDVVINQNLESAMYSAMLTLIRASNMEEVDKELLLGFYSDGDEAEFLGRAFLYSLVGDNIALASETVCKPIDADIRTFKELIKKAHRKPKSIEPPPEIQDHEIRYVQELYRVYSEVSSEEYARPEDLDSKPRLRRNFDQQRKDYYKAETIRRELRDTICLDESEGFAILKEEMFDGVITTSDKFYATGFDRMTAVMEHATGVELSRNLQDRMLDWVGPGEKKGVCHMLVNDQRLTWIEDESNGD